MSSGSSQKNKSCPSGWSKYVKDGRPACRYDAAVYCYLDGTGGTQCYGPDGKPRGPPGSAPTPAAPAPAAPAPTPHPSEACGQIYEIKHENIVKNIQELQKYEQNMFKALKQQEAGGDGGATTKQITARINELSGIRTRLFAELRNAYTAAQCDLNNDRQDLADQIAMVSLVEKELDNAKANINSLQTSRDNKLRMVEITNYETERYAAHKSIFRIIAFAAFGILLSVFIINRGYSNLGNAGIILSVGVAAYYTARNIYDNWWRNPWYWNQFEWNAGQDQLQPGYETVYEHDVLALEKGYRQGKSEASYLEKKGKKAFRKGKKAFDVAKEQAKKFASNTGLDGSSGMNTKKKKGAQASESFANYY